MKQRFRKTSCGGAAQAPARANVHWGWFAASRPALYWSFATLPVRPMPREPKPEQFAHE